MPEFITSELYLSTEEVMTRQNNLAATIKLSSLERLQSPASFPASLIYDQVKPEEEGPWCETKIASSRIHVVYRVNDSSECDNNSYSIFTSTTITR
jgi:hypothetical protein